MDVRPIKNDEDLTWALKEVSPYFDNQPPIGSPEGDRFEVLTTLIEAYEDEHYPIPEPRWDPIGVLRYFIDEGGHTQAELAKILGSRSRASEILSKRRALTVDMIHAICKAWKLPADLLAKPYKLVMAQAETARSRKKRVKEAA